MPRVAARKTRQGVCTAIGPENRLARTTKAKTVKGSREAMSHKKAKEAVIGIRGPAAAMVHRKRQRPGAARLPAAEGDRAHERQ